MSARGAGQRAKAVRILAWPHAAEHLTAVAEAVFGAQTPRAGRVDARSRRWLWQEGPDRVLTVLAGSARALPPSLTCLRHSLVYKTLTRTQSSIE